MTDRELLELIVDQVGTLTKTVDDLKEGQKKLEGRQKNLESEVKDIKKTVLTIEQDHGEKLSALFDGQIQNTARLERIEAEVVKHDEFILKRVR